MKRVGRFTRVALWFFIFSLFVVSLFSQPCNDFIVQNTPTLTSGSPSWQAVNCIAADNGFSVNGANVTFHAGAYIHLGNGFNAQPGFHASVLPAAPPSLVSVAPSNATGSQQTFSFVSSDPNGGADIGSLQLLFANVSGAGGGYSNACEFWIDRQSQTIKLRDNGNTTWGQPVTAGQTGTLSNNQCSLSAAGSSITPSGIYLTVNLAVTFYTAYSGTHTITMEAWDSTNFHVPPTAMGTYTVSFTQTGLSLLVTPNSQTIAPGGSISYTVTVTGTNGFGGNVSLSAQTPSGATAAFIPASVTVPTNGSAMSTMRITTTSGAQSGAITVTGTSGGLSNSAPATLVVSSGAAQIPSKEYIRLGSRVIAIETTTGNGPINNTVTTSPAGLSITVDSVNYTAPHTFQWTAGSSHSIGVSSPQSAGAGTQNVFASWSDGGAQTHNIIAPASPATYTSSFTTQYQLTTTTSPTVGGSISPASGWYNSGTGVTVSALGNSGYQFTGFSGDLTGSTPQNLTMNGPKSVTANFTLTVTVNASPTSLQEYQTSTITANQNVNWSFTGPGSLSTLGPSTTTVYTAPNAITSDGQTATITGSAVGNASNAQSVTVSLLRPTMTTDATIPSGTVTAGTPATFTFSGTDSAGFTHTQAYVLLMITPGGPSGNNVCMLRYEPYTQTMSLANDSGAYTVTGSLGAALSGNNSQCSLNAGWSAQVNNTTASVSGVAITFLSGFTGTKYVYADTYDNGNDLYWWYRGAITVQPLPVTVGASPTSLQEYQTSTITANQNVNWSFTGPGSLSTVGPSTTTVYTAPNAITSDGQTATITGSAVGNASNAQSVTVSLLRPTMTTTATVPSGTVTVGTPATFTFGGTNSAGFGHTQAFVLLMITSSGSPSGSNGCILRYEPYTQTMSLADDSGAYTLTGSLGAALSGNNSQCSLNAGWSAQVNSNTASVSGVAITFLSGFTGTKNVFADTYDNGNDLFWWWQGQVTINGQ